MSAIFLSAGVPVPDTPWYRTADPFLIQVAVRELIMAVIRDYTVVWGGHPAITPMIWAVCEDLGVDYSKSVVLYQSQYFEDQYPEENLRFSNTVFVDPVLGDREASLQLMRKWMLSRNDFTAAIFIGGMKGIFDEYELFQHYHPAEKVIALRAPGGAARELADKFGSYSRNQVDEVDFATLFRSEFPQRVG